MIAATRPLTFQVNGERHGPLDVPEGTMLIDVLHEWLGLTGTRAACSLGVCRACTVIVDEAGGSEELPACVTPAHEFDGKRIRTIEGHAKRNEKGAIVSISPVQQAFVDGFSFQCGYCTPGFVNAATILVERLGRSPVAMDVLDTTIMESLDPHLCRCTGYVRYFHAVRNLILATPGLVIESPR